MYKRELLIKDGLPPLETNLLNSIRKDYFEQSQKDCKTIDYKVFTARVELAFQNSHENVFVGLSSFSYKDVIIGCQHYIDNLISKGGLDNLQIFEHDYHYYKKLNPNIKYVTVDTLQTGKPLLIALPFPGHLGVHRQMDEILRICNEKNIDVHLDCSWMSSAFDIKFNFDQPCIKTFAMSFSKAYALNWNKVGIRWSRDIDETDSITIMNKSNMIPKSLLSIAEYYMDHLPVDYLCRTFKKEYFKICRELRLRPSNIIHACYSMDRKILYGLKNFFN